MRNFWDQTGKLWQSGALVGKVGSAFTSTSTQHGGQETTLRAVHTTFLHHGMVVVGLPYTAKGLSVNDEISGGSPYGASTVARGPVPTDNELELARYQGAHVARIASTLARAPHGVL